MILGQDKSNKLVHNDIRGVFTELYTQIKKAYKKLLKLLNSHLKKLFQTLMDPCI